MSHPPPGAALQSAVTDSFSGQADGGFWVSQMGDKNGGTPGRMARIGPGERVACVGDRVACSCGMPLWHMRARGGGGGRGRGLCRSSDRLTSASAPTPTHPTPIPHPSNHAGPAWEVVGEYPQAPPPGFNPHGFAIW